MHAVYRIVSLGQHRAISPGPIEFTAMSGLAGAVVTHRRRARTVSMTLGDPCSWPWHRVGPVTETTTDTLPDRGPLSVADAGRRVTGSWPTIFGPEGGRGRAPSI
jgi:hypothetical protein